MTFNINNVIGEMFGKDKQKLLEEKTSSQTSDKNYNFIKNKLKKVGWGHRTIVEYIEIYGKNGSICYKVKLDDKTIIWNIPGTPVFKAKNAEEITKHMASIPS